MSRKENSGSKDDEFQKTIARIENIKSHLERSPRGWKLKGKVCIITGANSLKGIGRASALLFAHEGARHLYLIDFISDNFPELEKLIQTSYADVKVTTIQADAADDEAISEVCQRALREECRLDVFFANAGIASYKHLHDLSTEEFSNTMRINALSAFLGIKYASDAMLEADPSHGKNEGGGSIILTASVAGLRSGAGSISYGASKAAVNNMAQSAAFQLQKTNIRVNSICPGLIETAMTEPTFANARKRGTAGKIGQLNPLRRYGVAEEVAQVVLFLASDESSYVNAQNIAIDGGLSGSLPIVPGKYF